ncbi:N-acetyllactosaminide beta-1,3-N-acetylglucosaminyltransferase 2 isoform 3-T4 [Dama dama]|nr:N-acetyllactosaminide beta-1,3-N-acetylglucosaminyltransferase 2 isoform X3 [Dama dama]
MKPPQSTPGTQEQRPNMPSPTEPHGWTQLSDGHKSSHCHLRSSALRNLQGSGGVLSWIPHICSDKDPKGTERLSSLPKVTQTWTFLDRNAPFVLKS